MIDKEEFLNGKWFTFSTAYTEGFFLYNFACA